MGRRVAAAFVVVGSLCGSGLSGADVDAIIIPATSPNQIEGVTATDVSGRFVITRGVGGSSIGRPNDARYDRLTGTRVELGSAILAVSADLRWAITTGTASGTDPRWRNIDTGESDLVPLLVPPNGWALPNALSADGQLLLSGVANAGPQSGAMAFVVHRDGTVEPAPLPRFQPIDFSANGRYALLSSECIPDVGLACRRYARWDRIEGTATILSASTTRFSFWIGDDGSVIESEWLTGDPFVGGDLRLVRRPLRGPAIELVGVGEVQSPTEVSDDGSILAFVDANQHLVMVDTATAARTVDTSVRVVRDGFAVGGTGAVVVAVPTGPGSAGVGLNGIDAATLHATSPSGRTAPPRLAAGETLAVRVAGVRNVPADASAVVLNVTVTNPAGPGFATVWPCDEPRPNASNVNVTGGGQTVANAVVSKVAVSGPSAGSVCVYTIAGVDLIVDVQGFFTGAAYTGVAPDRFVDTRNGETDSVGNVAAGGAVTVPVAGVRGVPAGASAAVLNVTVTNPDGPGFVTVWPCDEDRPVASNVNVTGAGRTVANAVVSKLAADGSVCVYTSAGADLIVDVQGYFTGAAYTGVAPDRFVDTRNGETDAAGNVPAGGVVTVPVVGVRGVAAGASAVVVNVTVTNPDGPGFVTVWPCDQARPDASNVNFTGAGVTIANAVVAKVAVSGGSAGSVCLYTSTGADLIVDVQGSFTGAAYTGVAPDRFLDSRG